MTNRKHRTLLQHPDEVPEFADEEEEARFWEAHDIGAEFWKQLPTESVDDMLPPRRSEQARADETGSTQQRVQR